MPTDLLSATEAAAALGVSRAWFNKLLRAGRVPGAAHFADRWTVPQESLALVEVQAKYRPLKYRKPAP